MKSRILLCISSLLFAFQIGCFSVGSEAPTGSDSSALVALPVAPESCFALYHIPAKADARTPDIVFPEGATVAEMPAKVPGTYDVSCALVVMKQGSGKPRMFWKIRTTSWGFKGHVQCFADGQSSPMFEIMADRDQGVASYEYTPVTEQTRVDALLQKGKITATWHLGLHSSQELYEQRPDGSVSRKKEVPLYKACHTD